jgi:RHS repeat-associated protein
MGGQSDRRDHSRRSSRWKRKGFWLHSLAFSPVAAGVTVALIAQLLSAPPAQARAGAGARIQAASQANSPPTPSGADPPYPLNHTMDGKVESLGTAPNSDFESPSRDVGTPPSNSNLEAPPVGVATVPNGDFETGTFEGWTQTGTPTIQTDPTHGYWARLGSDGQDITSSAVAIPQTAQSLVAEIYFQGQNSWVEIYALSGPNFETSTQLKYEYCSNCGWQTRFLDLSGYRGQTIKLRFRARYAPVGIDNVQIQQIFPGYQLSGDIARLSAGGNTYARVSEGASMTSPAFALDPAAQYGTVDVKGAISSAQYKVYVAAGPSFSTFTEVLFGFGSSDWQTVRFNLSSWAGQQIEVRVSSVYSTIYSDNFAARQILEVPSWDVTGNASLTSDGSGGHYVSTNGALTSSAIPLPTKVQDLSLRIRSEGSLTSVYVELLRGSNFSAVVTLEYVGIGSSWQTLRYSPEPYAGETVKLRIRRYAGSSIDVDDAGILRSLLPGWAQTSTGAIDSGEDANGTYVTGYNGAGLFLRSGWVSPGIVDRTNYADSRTYAISYDFGASGGLLQVFFNNDQGGGWTVTQDAANGPTGYRTRYFALYDFMGTRGTFGVKLLGGKFYSIGDNVARQHMSEAFSRKVGLGIDTSTGALGFADRDLSIPGTLPLTFTRYYNSHSDRFGSFGFRWSDTYDTRLVFNGDDVGVVWGSGREEFFNKQLDGSYTGADPRIHSKLVKNGDGTFTLTTKDNVSYRFDSQGTLTRIEDLNGNAIVPAYDGQGRLASVAADGGRTLTLGYDGSGRLTSLTDPAGSVYSYGYDANGDLVSVTNPLGGIRRYAYDRHRLTTVTDENGTVLVDNTYDDFHRVTSQTDALGKTITVGYETPGKGATRVTYPDGGVGTFYFDLFHRTTATVDPSGRTTSYLYDGNGNLDKIIDSGSQAWDYAFDLSGDLTSSLDPLGNPTSFTYTAKHLPASITDARGNVTTFTYDAKGNLLTVTDPLGNTTTYTYDAEGNVASVTDPLGNTTTYTYDAAGNRTSKTDPLGKTWTYTYTSTRKLETETDPLGDTTRYTYDLLGRLISIRDPLGRVTVFLYDPVGHLLRVTDPSGNKTTWAYDDRGLVKTKTDPEGNVTTYGYDANRNMTSVTDPRGYATTYGYDEAGRLTSVADPLGDTTTYTYDTAGRLASKADPLGRTTGYAYDPAGRLANVTLPNGGVLTYAYDPDGNLTSARDPLQHTTTNAYDADNHLASTTDPLGHATTYDYDAAGQLKSVTDPLGNKTSYAYDGAGRLKSETDPLQDKTSYGYDDAGRRTSVTDPTNRATAFGYDAAGQLASVTDPAGKQTTNGYNASGWLTSVTLPSGAKTTYGYDARGAQTSVTDPTNRTTSYTYDGAGNLKSQTDPAQHTTSYTYDPAGRLTTITDALGGTVGLGYNAASEFTSVVDPNNKTWTYGYNALGERNSFTDPLGNKTQWVYNDAGQLTSRTDARNITTSYGYNNAGDLTSITYPGGSIGYGYDNEGRRTTMTDPTGTTSFGYDAASRVTSVGAPGGTIAYTYDEAGRRKQMTLPGSKTIGYGYDTAGRVQSLTDWSNRTTSFGYDQDGNRTSITRPNGVTSTIGYDPAGRIASIAHKKGASTLQSFAYTYDEAGNRKSVAGPGGTESYTLDALNRLTQVAYPGGPTVSYTYDPAGNRKTQTTVSGNKTTTINYAYDAAGRLTTAGSTAYTYDKAGNTLTAGSTSYGWDFDSRLSSATVGNTTTTYTYDGDGVQVGAKVGRTSATYLVDREGGLPRIVDDGASSYLHAGGLVSSINRSNVATYALTDALGSVRGLTDSSGSLVGTRSYEAFGKTRTTSGSTSLFGFAGEPADSTGLIYLRARSLDPAIGRLVSADAVSPNAPGTQGYNPYAYAANNPTTWTDPTGHLVGDVVTELTDFALWEAEMGEGGALATLYVGFEETTAAAATGGGIAVMALAIAGIIVVAALLTCFVIDACRQAFYEAIGVIQANRSLSPEGKIQWSPTEVETAPSDYPAPATVEEPSLDEDWKPFPIIPTRIGWKAPEEGQLVFRVWGGEAKEWRASWTPEDPRIYGSDKYRIEAGLPDRENLGTMLTVARIRDPSGVRDVRIAEPMFPPRSYCRYEHPHLLEYVVPLGYGLDPVASFPLSPPYGGRPPEGCP